MWSSFRANFIWLRTYLLDENYLYYQLQGLLITTIHKSLQRINGLDLFPTQMHQHTCYKTYQYRWFPLTIIFITCVPCIFIIAYKFDILILSIHVISFLVLSLHHILFCDDDADDDGRDDDYDDDNCDDDDDDDDDDDIDFL